MVQLNKDVLRNLVLDVVERNKIKDQVNVFFVIRLVLETMMMIYRSKLQMHQEFLQQVLQYHLDQVNMIVGH